MKKPTTKRVTISSSNWSRLSYQKKGIILHWIVGELSAADATFKNPSRNASAHYGIGSNGEIHQYVEDKWSAWHAGVWHYNKHYIGIEHAGGQMVGKNRKKPTKEAHEASAKLVAWLCHEYKIPCNRKNIFGHRAVKSTQCPGTLDMDWIVNRANQIMKGDIEDPIVKKTEELKAKIAVLEKDKEVAKREIEKYKNIVASNKKIEDKNKQTIEKLTKEIKGKDNQIADMKKQYDQLKKRQTEEILDNLLFKFIQWIKSALL